MQILADAMGLGKTVMTIALILARLGKGCPDNKDTVPEDPTDTEYIRQKRKSSNTEVRSRARGGTLIICPMALLSQWKVSLPFIFNYLILLYIGFKSRRAPKFYDFCLPPRMSLRPIRSQKVYQSLFTTVAIEALTPR